jgi:hypothetical protein
MGIPAQYKPIELEVRKMSKKTGLSPRQIKTLLKLCGDKFGRVEHALTQGSFWASTEDLSRSVKTTVPPVNYMLYFRVANAYYHPYSELRDKVTGKVIHTNEGPFYWGTIYTKAQMRPKHKKKWRDHEYQKHFVSGKTWAEFRDKFAEAVAKEYV